MDITVCHWCERFVFLCFLSLFSPSELDDDTDLDAVTGSSAQKHVFVVGRNVVALSNVVCNVTPDDFNSRTVAVRTWTETDREGVVVSLMSKICVKQCQSFLSRIGMALEG